MPNRSLVLPILFATAAALFGCDLTGADPQVVPPRQLTEHEARVVESDNRFGLTLFREISRSEPHENVFISPLSVSMALGMTLNGAGGETYEAMRAALEKKGLSEQEINESYRSLIDLLHDLDPKVVFDIANSIWHRQGFGVEPEFIDVNETYFDAVVRELDFGAPDAVRTINSWVDDATRGKIEKIIDRIGPDVVMYLINAVYFKGTWTYEFDEDVTRDGPFTRLDSSQAQVPMMSQRADLPYFATERFQAVDLPYGDSLYSMTVVLPNQGEDLHELIADLDDEAWRGYASRFKRQEVRLQLPRFKLEYEITLNDALTALGMGVAFDEARADFTRINPGGNLYISRVIHKTYVDVNEEGTEAAAVTAVEIELTSISGVEMHVDRPFLFVIRERHSGTILFIGKVVNL